MTSAQNTLSNDELRALIDAVVRERFPDGRVVAVRVRRGVDFDGDPILQVELIFDNESGYLDAKRASGMVRHIRSKLAEKGEYDFPLLSFIGKSEAGSMEAEVG